jgi:hypothetical protein
MRYAIRLEDGTILPIEAEESRLRLLGMNVWIVGTYHVRGLPRRRGLAAEIVVTPGWLTSVFIVADPKAQTAP